jgi:hypothetical protein
MQLSDSARGSSEISISVFFAPGLLRHLKTLDQLASSETDSVKADAVATASILLAAAAAEAVLSEAAYLRISGHRGRPFQPIVDGISDERGRRFRLIVDDVSA